jgi:ABC-type branched-subunit amino acid transport system substrate-binding protein
MKLRKYGITGLGLGLVLAGCGGGGGDDAEGGAEDPIKIMSIATFESDVYSLPWVQTAIEAAVADINENGGVDGRQIEASFCNDQYDPNETTACAQRAVSEGVTALIGGVTANEAVMVPILEAAQIPFIGPPGVDAVLEAENELFYPINGAGIVPMYGLGQLAVSRGGPNVVMGLSDTDQARTSGEIAAEAVEAGGGRTSTVIAPLGAPDYAPTAASILSNQPDAVLLSGGGGDMLRIVSALRQAGYEGTIAALSSIATVQSIAALGDDAENLVLASRGLSALTTDNPVIAEFNEQMKAQDEDAVIDDLGLNAWMSVRTFAEAIKGHEITDGASVIEALDAIDEPIDQGGVYPDYPGPVDPAPEERYPRVAVFEMMPNVIKDGQVVSDGDFYNPLEAD